MTNPRFTATARWLTAAIAALSSAGCFYGGSPGTGTESATADSGASAQLDWGDASGPVAGYRIFVSRNESDFEVANDVTTSNAIVEGEPMDTVRIQVAAFDAQGQLGPISEPSNLILLTTDGKGLVISKASPAMTADAAAATERAIAASASAKASVSKSAVANTPSATQTEPVSPLRQSEKTSGDLVGDGIANLLWETGDFLRVTRLSGDAVESVAVFARPDTAWAALDRADFDGDGLGDLLWAHDDGSLAYTPMGLALDAPSDAPLTSFAALVDGESVVGSGDLDADGLADLLVSDGLEVSVWFGGSGADVFIESVATFADSGEIEAVGDVDGDDRSDLIWRTPDGGLTVWLMDGAEPVAFVDLPVGADAEVLACADIDGDGGDDVVLRDRQSGALSIQPIAAAGWSVLPDASGLVLAGSADYDGDGRADLLWDTGAGLELWAGIALGSVVPMAVLSDMHTDWELVPEGL